MHRRLALLPITLLVACAPAGGITDSSGPTVQPISGPTTAVEDPGPVRPPAPADGLGVPPGNTATTDLSSDAGGDETTSAPVDGVDSLDALVVLDGLVVDDERRAGYDRELFAHWSDEDGDGCTTRHEVLLRDSRTPAQIDPYRCFVVAGDWYSSYDDATHTDPTALDVDHLVPLAEAWDSGAWAWDGARRTAFANDLGDERSLQAVTDSVNQAKSDQDPADWLPPFPAYRCHYLADWVAVKFRWGLTVDRRERDAIAAQLLGACADTRVMSVEIVETAGRPAGTTPTDDAAPTASPVTYANCDAVRAAGAAPLRRDAPGYRPALDGDGDGVACE